MTLISLLEYQVGLNDQTTKQGVVQKYAQSSEVLRVLGFKDITGGAYAYTREDTLATVAFRGIGGSYTANSSVLLPLVEIPALAGGKVEIDTALIKRHGVARKGIERAMKIKALAQTWTVKFFKGDPETDSNEFWGLQSRVIGDQLVPAGATSGGNVLSLTKLDQAIDQCIQPDVMFTTKAILRLMKTAARTAAVAGNINYTLDEFGRDVMTYNSIPMLAVDTLGMATAPLGYNEVASGGGSAVTTSIYICHLGEAALHGIQTGPISV
ncbi:MAG TPA: hypothetical protein ENG14_02350, partial [Thermodesulforhabdus norvegica]|nr:hypothetical protein [Thermodesulforhabdus norvegica]